MLFGILSEEMQCLSGRVRDLRSTKLLTAMKTNQTDKDSHPNFFLHTINTLYYIKGQADQAGATEISPFFC